jgi:hypothetical protein
MRKLYVVALILGGSFTSGHLAAQDFDELIKGSRQDANYLLEGYLSPIMKSVGAGFNQGWYNTAKTHKKFGVDFTISVAAIGVPSSDKFFTVNNSKLNSIELTADHNGDAPVNGSGKVHTIFGPGPTQSEFTYKSPLSGTIDGLGGEIDLKKDLPMGRLPVPVVHLGFGLPKSIDVKLRFIPSVGSDDFKVQLFGLGVMHDIKQYIPGIKLLPFDLSGFVGYTRLKVTAELNNPSQTSEFVVNATTVQGLISKKISVLTFYGGIGYNFSKANLAAKGYYDLNGVAGDGPNNSDEEVKNPVDLSVAQSGPRATAGMRLKLAVFTFHGDYTLQKYSAFTAGFGINVR